MIIVTGASRGIGRAIADRLTSVGQDVLGLSRSGSSELFELVSVDVTSEVALKQLSRTLRDRKEPVTALVNAAGVASMNLALTTPANRVRQVLETNLMGVILASQAFAPLLIRSGGGSIINFSTIAVHLALQGESAYIASKAGVEAFSRTLARELSQHNIRVNCIAPGPIDTDLLKGVSENQVSAILRHQIFPKKFSVDDVADVVELLLNNKASSLTGHVFHIGGV